MKKCMVIAICLALVYGAQAQHGHVVAVYHGPVYVYRPSLSFGVGYFAPFYSPFGYYGFPYSGYYPYAGYSSPSKLQRQEADIRADYEDRIYSVRQDSSLTKKEKRQNIRSLKKQRDQEIHDLVANYHKEPVTK
jgi:hypothetical protein